MAQFLLGYTLSKWHWWVGAALFQACYPVHEVVPTPMYPLLNLQWCNNPFTSLMPECLVAAWFSCTCLWSKIGSIAYVQRKKKFYILTGKIGGAFIMSCVQYASKYCEIAKPAVPLNLPFTAVQKIKFFWGVYTCLKDSAAVQRHSPLTKCLLKLRYHSKTLSSYIY